MRINEFEINFRIGKMWGRLEKCERRVADSDRLYKRGAFNMPLSIFYCNSAKSVIATKCPRSRQRAAGHKRALTMIR